MRREVLVYDGLQRCPYLRGRVARMPLFRQLEPLGLDDADARFATAERRVGQALYHTACPSCNECKGLRVLVDEFQPSRSQRRVVSRWPAEARVEVGRPTVDDAKLALFNRHKQQRDLVEPGDEQMTALGYAGWLVQSCFQTLEMRYYLRDRLIGVGVLDVGRTAMSSVYFYFDPDPEVARLSPGVYSVLKEIEFCRRTDRQHLYLGLYVKDCRQLAYKATYRPHERLVDGDWRRFE